MTWKEFKEFIDKKVDEMGELEEIRVCYIDVDYPTEAMIEIGKDFAGYLVVSSM